MWLFHFVFLKAVPMFNCSPSFNLQLTSYTSSPAVQPSPYLPSSGRLQSDLQDRAFSLDGDSDFSIQTLAESLDQ